MDRNKVYILVRGGMVVDVITNIGDISVKVVDEDVDNETGRKTRLADNIRKSIEHSFLYKVY